jgi:A/G-specific adenine glycosylase
MPLRGDFMLREDFGPSDLPTVMRKAFDLVYQGTSPQMTSGNTLL